MSPRVRDDKVLVTYLKASLRPEKTSSKKTQATVNHLKSVTQFVFGCPCLFSYFGQNGGFADWRSILSSGLALRLLRIFATTRFGQGRGVWALMLAALFLPVCVPQCHSQTAQGGKILSDTINGTVLNSVTREPIGHALVYTLGNSYATFTDDRGHFELSLADQAPGSESRGQPNVQTTMLLVKKPGFLTITGLPAGTSAVPGQNDLTLTLIPEALIVGQVKFPNAEAADRVQVQLYRREIRDGSARWEQMAQTSTRADGEYRFAELRAGEYRVFTLESTERDPLTTIPNGPVFGFPPRYFAAARDFASADTIQVHAGETIAAEIAPERQRYYDVRVPVVSGQPSLPQGIAVSVYAQGHRGPGFALGYDQNQHVIRGSLPNGTYTIEAASYEHEPATGMTNITVANAPLVGPPLTLAPGVSIEINVRQDSPAGENPQGAPNVYVSLESAEEFPVESGSGGNYQAQGNPLAFQGVAPGRYWVRVNPSASGMYFASVTSGTKDLLRTPLVVPYGASVPPIEITVRYDGAEIDATLDGKPFQYNSVGVSGTVGSVGRRGPVGAAAGPSVYCIPVGNEGGPAREFFTLADGSFTLQQIPPGDYRVLAFDSPTELEYRNPAAMRVYESKGQVVHLTSGQKLQLQLQPIKSD